MSLSAFLSPGPVKVATNAAREALDFDGTTTYFSEAGSGTGSDMVPIPGLQNLPGRCYSIDSRDVVAPFANGRAYTAKILHRGAHKIDSSMMATHTFPNGEQVDFNVLDVERSGDNDLTTALCHAVLDRY